MCQDIKIRSSSVLEGSVERFSFPVTESNLVKVIKYKEVQLPKQLEHLRKPS